MKKAVTIIVLWEIYGELYMELFIIEKNYWYNQINSNNLNFWRYSFHIYYNIAPFLQVLDTSIISNI